MAAFDFADRKKLVCLVGLLDRSWTTDDRDDAAACAERPGFGSIGYLGVIIAPEQML